MSRSLKGGVFIKLDILTLAFILSLTLVTQVSALFLQYRVNKTYSGIGCWLLGSSLMALGFIFMPLLTVKSLEMLARIANPLVILGHIFLYIGILQFLNKKLNQWIPISIFLFFTLSYYNYMYFNNDISSRTVVVQATIAIISFMISYQLFFKNDRLISCSANFTATVFLVYGCFSTLRTFLAIMLPPMRSYSDQAATLIVGFIVPIITSALWTFGLIIMVNQRLNNENQVEKEKLQLVFNTSPDAELITRLNDGLFVDVNTGFSVLSGYTRAEVIGTATLKIIWHNIADQKSFTTKLNDRGICVNEEFLFQRKDGSQFVGMISGRIIEINTVPHIISVIRDITERKLAEQQIQKLVQQLEIEKNTAQLNSITDSLTGLANRRYFDEALRTEFYRMKRSGSTLSLIMLDVDYFKKFNDRYGHLAGDECLRLVGTTLRTIVGRAPDIVARYGGEEFVVILPETDKNGAKSLGERIRKAVEELAIPHAASDIAECVTVSLGVVTVYTNRLASPEKVVSLADEALYCAKKGGRNQIAVAPQLVTKVLSD
ncbi:sensor domain-containing diguanylate cyclase [Desulfosporosinus meridiei]|uniref:PAS domain S-box/diguanylate cyclase (GGDEF) domain-containing protein n=1 Tax=Desulfosporosinus meridiei (strain ATCC BAA-275 / DSM 13257 / KCTC 12902 / NCIMB 13706 / S10) TaxID=768704 RepID=J7IP18_DESMD|nr:sensor domain-containing diguanylate cyclase [Desulfosporosinus meridiei]AFQ43330.1 PAS domain S-box/diguanylate cyclase (GGDEF) domain-containing protein [Desulfosporosinus meridiei DSM 13257]